jgi:hypothetical protein
MASVRRTVTTPDRTYTVVDGDWVPTSGLVIARVVDAPSGNARPVRRVLTNAPHTFAHVAFGGYLVLTGRPELVVPNLNTQSQQLPARIEFYDLAPLELLFTIPAGTTLPFRAPDITVEPLPTSLSGTVTTEAFPHSPIPGAAIAVGAPAPPPTFTALRTPLAVAHAAGVMVRERTLAPAAAATTLTQPVEGGGTRVRLLSTAGCTTANGVLALGDDSTQEQVRIVGIDLGLSELTLAAPLRRSRASGTPVRAYVVTATGATTTLARAAAAGDGVVELAGALAPGVIEVAGVTSELRITGLVSDVAGRWRLDGVRSIGTLTLTVSAAGFTTLGPFPYDVDYRRPNLIDLGLA